MYVHGNRPFTRSYQQKNAHWLANHMDCKEYLDPMCYRKDVKPYPHPQSFHHCHS